MKPRIALIALSAIVVLGLLMPGSASAASPVLEFVTPGSSLPVGFTSEGGPVVAELAGFEAVVHCAGSTAQGEITGPRSTVSKYAFTGCVAIDSKSEVKCKSAGANPEEIRTGLIAAQLVNIDQATHEVGILLNPGGGVYMSFECGGEATEARGPFLSSITPVNSEASAFTATLTQAAGIQTPDEYEDDAGTKLKATPEGKRGSNGWVTTGVALTITVHPSFPVEIRAITAEEVQAKQREEDAKRRDQQRLQEEAAASAKKHQEEAAAASKRHDEELAAASRHQDEERAAGQAREKETLASLKAAIARALTASARIGALLNHRGLTLPFSAPESGTVVVQWWLLPPAAHLAKNAKPKPTLIAQGKTAFARAGVGRVKINLTRAGRRLLAHTAKQKLTTRVRFTPTTSPTISATGAITLRP